jgi:hypothetical protein
MLNNKIVWNLSDDSISLNDVDSTLSKVNQVIQAKAAALSMNVMKSNSAEFEFTNKMLPILNALYELRENIVMLDTIVCIKNNDSKVFVSCVSNDNLNSVRPYKYICFTK